MLSELQPAFLLHSRKYTDSRIIVEFLTQSHGRISGVARQQRTKKKTGAILAFTPSLISWKGKGQLKTITAYEAAEAAVVLPEKSLYCGFYLNEILLRALAVEDPVDGIYELYRQTLEKLSGAEREQVRPTDQHSSKGSAHIDGSCPDKNSMIEACLRCFELSLIEELGFGVNFERDDKQDEILPNSATHYRLINNERFSKVTEYNEQVIETSYSGETLRDIATRNFDSAVTLRSAKSLCRVLMRPLIGDRPLQSREFFK